MSEEWFIVLGKIGHELLLMVLFLPIVCVIILGGIYALVRRMD